MLEYIKGEESTHHGCSRIIIPIPQPPRIPTTCQFSAWTLPKLTCSRWLLIVVHCVASNWYVIAFRSGSLSQIELSQSQVCGYHQWQGWQLQPSAQMSGYQWLNQDNNSSHQPKHRDIVSDEDDNSIHQPKRCQTHWMPCVRGGSDDRSGSFVFYESWQWGNTSIVSAIM